MDPSVSMGRVIASAGYLAGAVSFHISAWMSTLSHSNYSCILAGEGRPMLTRAREGGVCQVPQGRGQDLHAELSGVGKTWSQLTVTPRLASVKSAFCLSSLVRPRVCVV